MAGTISKTASFYIAEMARVVGLIDPTAVERFAEVINEAMDTPAIKSRMQEIGVTGVSPDRRSPEYLAKFVVDEIARWEGPIKSGGLQVD